MSTHNIPGATSKQTADGTQTILKLKVRLKNESQTQVAFSLRPIKGTVEEYKVQITCSELPGLFKNSGASSFGPFVVKRHPGRNAIERPTTLRPIAGNAVLMFPHLTALEQQRCYEFLEKLLRTVLPKLPITKAAA